MIYELFYNLQKEILEFPVHKLECKHVILDKPLDVFNDSVKSEYEYVTLGSHRHASINEENKRIFKMVTSKKFNKPVRIVLAKDGRLWCDNTHTAMAYISRNLKVDIKLKDIPFYLIDIRRKKPIVYSVNNSVIKRDTDIQNAILCSLEINKRIDKGVRPCGMTYTVGELHSKMQDCTRLILKKWYASIYNAPSFSLSERRDKILTFEHSILD